MNRTYKRKFYAMKQGKPETGGGKEALGSLLAETFGNEAKLSLGLQNLQPATKYKLCLFRIKGGEPVIAEALSILTDLKGRYDGVANSDARDCFGSGVNLDDFNCFAVVFEGHTEKTPVLTSFKDETMNLHKYLNSEKKPEAMPEPAPEPVQEPFMEAIVEPESAAETLTEPVEEQSPEPEAVSKPESTPEPQPVCEPVPKPEPTLRGTADKTPAEPASKNAQRVTPPYIGGLSRSENRAAAQESFQTSRLEVFTELAKRFSTEIETLSGLPEISEEEYRSLMYRQAELEMPCEERNEPENILDFAAYQAVQPFNKQSADVEWIKIGSEELSMLPKIKLSRQQTQAAEECCGQHEHCIFGRYSQMGEENYILGIPDTYKLAKRMPAFELGFKQFKPCGGEPLKNGVFGYWLMVG